MCAVCCVDMAMFTMWPTRNPSTELSRSIYIDTFHYRVQVPSGGPWGRSLETYGLVVREVEAAGVVV